MHSQEMYEYLDDLPQADREDFLKFRAARITAKDVLFFLGEELPDDEDTFWRKAPPKPNVSPHNTDNRPYKVGTAKHHAKVILDGEHELTGETMIFGERNSVLNAQHRFGGLMWARHLWQKAKDSGKLDELYPYWAEQEPFIEVCLVAGISEDNKVVNKIDTGRNRSTSDVIYRDYNFSDNFDEKSRVILSRIVTQAVRLVWGRMNGKTIRSMPKLDQRESVTFIHQHPGIVAMTEYVYLLDKDVNDPGCVSRVAPPAALVGLGYLMATARTRLGYGRSDPNEINYTLLEQAKTFIRSLAKGDGLEEGNPILVLRNILMSIKGIAAKKDRENRVRMIIQAWNLWIDGKRSGVTLADITPSEGSDPRIGGLDVEG